MAKNREIMWCTFYFISFFCFLNTKPRKFRNIGKAWKGSLDLGSCFSTRYFHPASPANPSFVTILALATYTGGTPCVFQAVRETEVQRLQNFPNLATVEAKPDLISPSSPEPLSPVATNGIKNTDYVTEKNNINQASQNNTSNLKQAWAKWIKGAQHKHN